MTMKRWIFFFTVIALLVTTAAGAAELAVDSVGCRAKKDLWVVAERSVDKDPAKALRAFVNTGSCFPFREGEKVEVIQHAVTLTTG